MEKKWWYAPDSFINEESNFQSTTKRCSEDNKFKNAQKLRITVEGAWIHENMDRLMWTKTNDLIIFSQIGYGSKPPIKKVHFYEKNVKEKKWIPIVFHPDIYATSDFNESIEEINIGIFVYDEDGLNKSKASELSSNFASAASIAAIAFPVLLPYSPLISSVGKSLIGIISNMDDHDEIINGNIRLAVNKSSDEAYNLLQPGFFVCFAEPVEIKNLILKEDKKVYTKKGDLYTHNSYIVLRVTKDTSISSEFLINQRMATLLSELEKGKGENSIQALDFLQDTMSSYSLMKKLKRYKELKKKSIRTEDEENLYHELSNDDELSEYYL
ncbi:hypothetical protein [Psychrilyobacter atlanticus]|uniref:hypothetical protein n=1 Tax=Psychrilyobacter atlanticus TaxID=271091 RepID=UPI00042A5174|nr:hypothetical protein [Psychrilyobacter atlanticus]